jgi:hypothetical protein
MSEKPSKPKPELEPIVDEPTGANAMDRAKRIMKRLVETPYEPHKPLGKRASKYLTPKPKERPASKGRVHKGKTRS